MGRVARIRAIRICAWCRGAIDVTARADSRFCSTRCRQGSHRAGIRRSELEATAGPLRFAYADPPYPGKAGMYRGHPDYAGEVDHAALLSRLQTYDGWALSTSAAALPSILSLAVAQGLTVRVAAWFRGARPHPTARIVNAWEPVVFAGGRRVGPREATATLDALVGVSPRRRSTLPTAVIGMKPPAFCEWLFRLLGAAPGDSLDDLYPGSGIVGRSWQLHVAPSSRDASRTAAADG